MEGCWGCRKVAGESTVEGDGEQTLKEGDWNIVALEFYFVFLTTLDGGCEDGVDGEQEEVMVTSGGIRDCCVRRKRSHFHGAEASGHSLEAVIGEELELPEKKEAEERAAGRDVLFVGDEYLCEFFV